MSLFGNWFVRIALVLAVVAVLGFDGVECVVAHVGGKDDASNAAYAAAQAWNTQTQASSSAARVIAVKQAALATLPAGDRLVSCSATDPQAQNWTCTIVRHARTVVFGHLSFLRGITVARETGDGSYAP